MPDSKARLLSKFARDIDADGNLTDSGLASGASGGGGVTAYDSAGLLPISGLTNGDQAWASNRLFISNGSGWYNVNLVNLNPSIGSGPDGASYSLDSNGGTATSITISASDSDGTPIIWTYSTSDSAYELATITNDSDGTFTVTAKSLADILTAGYDSNGGSFTITFKASDGISFDTDSADFSITYYVSVGPAYEWDSNTDVNGDYIVQTGARSDFLGYNNIGLDKTGVLLAAAENDRTYLHKFSGSSWSSASYVDVGTNGSWGGIRIGGSANDPHIVIVTHDLSRNLRYWVIDPDNWNTEFTSGNSSTLAVGGTQNIEGGIDCWSDGSSNVYLLSGQPRHTAVTDREGIAKVHYSTDSGSTFSTTTIDHPDPSTTDFFGQHVAISGNVCIVGAPNQDSGGSNRGAAYVFKTDDNWATYTHVASFSGDSFGAGINGHGFGSYVDIADDTGTIIIAEKAVSTTQKICILEPDNVSNPTSYTALAPDITDHLTYPVAINAEGTNILAGKYVSNGSSANDWTLLRKDDGTWTEDATFEGWYVNPNANGVAIQGEVAATGVYSYSTNNGIIITHHGTET